MNNLKQESNKKKLRASMSKEQTRLVVLVTSTLATISTIIVPPSHFNYFWSFVWRCRLVDLNRTCLLLFQLLTLVYLTTCLCCLHLPYVYRINQHTSSTVRHIFRNLEQREMNLFLLKTPPLHFVG